MRTPGLIVSSLVLVCACGVSPPNPTLENKAKVDPAETPPPASTDADKAPTPEAPADVTDAASGAASLPTMPELSGPLDISPAVGPGGAPRGEITAADAANRIDLGLFRQNVTQRLKPLRAHLKRWEDLQPIRPGFQR